MIVILIISLLCAYLGAYGGAENTSLRWRRIGIPIILTLLAYLKLMNPLVIVLMSLIGAFSLGYGIPRHNTLFPDDNGSTLGRFWYPIFRENRELTNIAIRLTISIIIAIILLVIPSIKHNWFIYIICCLLIAISYSLISWQNWGSVIIFRTKLSWVEIVIYFCIGLFTSILIIY